MQTYNVTLTGTLDVQVIADSPEGAEFNLMERFKLALATDELNGVALPRGGEILGFKASRAEAYDRGEEEVI